MQPIHNRHVVRLRATSCYNGV